MKKLGIGVVGWGFMGKTHTHALLSIPLFYPGAPFSVELRHISTRREEKAREAASAAGFARWSNDWHELMADESVDVVSICTPNAEHEQMAVEALKAGKHVYIDKPLSTTFESAAAIARAAESSPQLHTRVAFNLRFFPSVMRAKELMDEGRVGRVLSFQARYLHSGPLDPAKPIGWKQQAQGGVLLDMGSHALDLLTWLCGSPRRASARFRTLYAERPTRDGGVERSLSEDQFLAMVELEGGALGCVEASKIATGAEDELQLEIRGNRGALLWNSMAPDYLDFFDQTVPDVPLGGQRGFTRIASVARFPAPGGTFLPPKNSIGWDRSHIHCYYTFLEEIALNRPGACSIADGARLQGWMDALRRSALSDGAWLEL